MMVGPCVWNIVKPRPNKRNCQPNSASGQFEADAIGMPIITCGVIETIQSNDKVIVYSGYNGAEETD
jgi:hypothetical protein